MSQVSTEALPEIKIREVNQTQEGRWQETTYYLLDGQGEIKGDLNFAGFRVIERLGKDAQHLFIPIV